MKDSLSYKISYKIGYGVGRLVINILMFLFNYGVMSPSRRSMIVRITYIVLGGFLLLSFIIPEISFSFVFGTILMISFVLGVIEFFRERPVRKMRNYFNKVFDEVNLSASDGHIPCYLYDYKVSDYVRCFCFDTLIPLNVWHSKKQVLEKYFNERIVDIKEDMKNNRIINLFTEENPLPSMLDWEDDYLDRKSNVLNIGVGYYGVVGMDLEKYPHAFIAGETGCGKSSVLKCMIYQSLSKGYDVILIDFKRGVSFSHFCDVVSIYYDYKSTLSVLKEMVTETSNRLDLFRTYRVDNINDYNKLADSYLRRKIIFIDELAELLKTRDKEISNTLYDSIETLTRLSRAVGIHLILGIQRPDSTIINGQIKNNVPYRICGRFVDKEPSRIMLSNDMATRLPVIKGRFIVRDDDLVKIQAFYYTSGAYAFKKEESLITDGEAKVLEEVASTKALDEEAPLKASELEFDFSDVKRD